MTGWRVPCAYVREPQRSRDVCGALRTDVLGRVVVCVRVWCVVWEAPIAHRYSGARLLVGILVGPEDDEVGFNPELCLRYFLRCISRETTEAALRPEHNASWRMAEALGARCETRAQSCLRVLRITSLLQSTRIHGCYAACYAVLRTCYA